MSKPSPNPFLKNAVLTSAIAWAGGLAGAIWLGVIDLPARNDANLQQLAGAMLTQQATLIETGLRHQSEQITYLATRSDIQHAVGPDTDVAQREILATQLQFAIPQADSVVLLPLDKLGIAGLDQQTSRLRNNIEFDLVRAASQGETIIGELYQSEGQWIVSQVTPIKNGADIIGALLVRYRAALVSQWMQSATKAGQLTLSLAPGNATPITALQAGSGGDAGHALTQDIATTRWQLTFAPTADTVASLRQSPLLIWLAAVLGPLAVSVWAFIGQRHLARSAQQDVTALGTYCDELIKQPKKAQPPALQLPLAGIADLLQQMTQRVAKAAAAPAADKNGNRQEAVASKTTAASKPEAIPSFDEVLDLDNVLDLTSVDVPTINDGIFREYDIRGIAERDLDENVVYQLGLAIGSEAAAHDQRDVVVGYDGRLTSTALADALIRGLTDSGRDVINIGLVPTPLLYFATHELKTNTGVMVTGSHNPPDYNGLKIVINGETLFGERIQQLKQRIQTQNFTRGQGSVSEQDVADAYVNTIIGDVAVAQPLKVVIDCGNGAGGELAPRVIAELGCEVIPLFCDIDGNFPNHHPDPSIASNLDDLVDAVRREDADIGIALDGDADRIGIVSKRGNIIHADRLLMLFAQDVVSRNPGADVIFDVKCTRHLNSLVSSYGGRPILWKSGHSNIKSKMQETGALLGGELSGHIFFKERWFGFDDGIYAAARLIEILSTTDPDIENLLAQFPTSVSTPELHVAVSEERKFALMQKLTRALSFPDAKITQLDGVRADFPDGWGLVRASNTTPVLTLRFEAETTQALQRIEQQFKQQMIAVDGSLNFPF